jgi:hypothetical protein
MTEKHEFIHVRVTFPISKKGAYEHEDPRDTTVGEVLSAAMKHFEVEHDTQFTYVLTFEGVDQADAASIGSLAGDHERIHLTLVKKIAQG